MSSIITFAGLVVRGSLKMPVAFEMFEGYFTIWKPLRSVVVINGFEASWSVSNIEHPPAVYSIHEVGWDSSYSSFITVRISFFIFFLVFLSGVCVRITCLTFGLEFSAGKQSLISLNTSSSCLSASNKSFEVLL